MVAESPCQNLYRVICYGPTCYVRHKYGNRIPITGACGPVHFSRFISHDSRYPTLHLPGCCSVTIFTVHDACPLLDGCRRRIDTRDRFIRNRHKKKKEFNGRRKTKRDWYPVAPADQRRRPRHEETWTEHPPHARKHPSDSPAKGQSGPAHCLKPTRRCPGRQSFYLLFGKADDNLSTL